MAFREASADAYTAYREEIEREPLARALYRAVVVLFVINTVFIGVDHIVYPERAADFLPVRIALDVILGGIYFATVRRFPVASTIATSAAGGWMLLTVVNGTGGPASDYYVGLVLLLIGIGVLVPLSARQGTITISAIFGCYVAMLFASGGSSDGQGFALSLFFLGAASFIGIMSCAYLDRMRFADFLQRREIEKARDELAELDVAKSRFTANIHHELRTPLTLTLAPVEAMLSGEFGEISELQRGYLKTIRSNGLRLLKLINNLLDLAKIESEQLEVKRRPVRMGDLVAEIVSGAVPLAERKGISLTTEGLDALPLLNVDPEALEKIVVNLLGNALKFTDAGESITVSATPEGGGVHLVVADTGIGIPPEQLGRIFDRFAQVDGSSTRRHEGTGIGLSLVAELVDLHGGRIWAESGGEGQGTRMHVVLPLGESDIDGDDAIEDVVLDSKTGGSAGRSLDAMGAELELEEDEPEYGDDLRLAELSRNVERAEGESGVPAAVAEDSAAVDPDAPEVIVVDDNPDMRRLLRFLVGQEFRVRTARNGREGLALVRERRPHLVLTDVMMPEMSGTELCSAIKSDESTAGIPVVLVTSKAEREMKIEGLELGADDYVTKPFHPRELMARVRSLVRMRLLQQELGVRNRLLESTNEELRSTTLELREAGAQLVKAERLAAVGELAAGVAHEVNNPVNFALNAMKTLRSYVADVRRVIDRVAVLDLEDREALDRHLSEIASLRSEIEFELVSEALSELGDIIAEGLERTSRLVGDLRDFAAPGDRGESEVDIARGLRSTLQLMGHSLASSGVEVHVQVSPELPGFVGDARGLNQVFLNLLKNAAEAFEGAPGVIEVRVDAEEGWIRVEIQDDGPGIDPTVAERLFEPFFTTKEAGRGSGLGLSITQRIVEEHGGTIDYVKPDAGGSCFRIRLPALHESSEPGDALADAEDRRAT